MIGTAAIPITALSAKSRAAVTYPMAEPIKEWWLRRGRCSAPGHADDAASSEPASTAFHPIPGASLFGGSGSLFDRFNSLFGRLGNVLCDAGEINDLAAQVRSRKTRGSGFPGIFPPTWELRRPAP